MGSTLQIWLLASTPAAWGAEVYDERPGEGFDRAWMDVGGFIQPRFDHVPDDDDAGMTGDFGYSLQRVRAQIRGGFEPEGDVGLYVGYKLSIELMPEARLQDAYMEAAAYRPMTLRVGQFEVPTNRAVLTSDQNILLPEQTVLTDWIPSRDIGAMVHGHLGEHHLEYQAGVFNGEGTNRLGNVNRKFLYAGRVVVSPLGGPGTGDEILRDWKAKDADTHRPAFSVGVAVHRNETGLEPTQEGTFGVNGEVFVHYRFVTAQGEYLWRTIDYEDPSISDYEQYGWYGQAGVFLVGIPWAEEHVAITGRVEQGDSLQAEGVPPAGPEDETQADRRITLGAGLYAGEPFFPRIHNLRLVAGYTFKEELEGFSFDDDRFAVAANLSF